MSPFLFYAAAFFIGSYAGSFLNVKILLSIICTLIVIWLAKFFGDLPTAFNDDEEASRYGKALVLFVSVSLFKLYVSTSQTWLQEFANAYVWR